MSVYAGPEIVTDGLVLSLDAASSRSYPRSGNAWIDLSGNGYTGNLINSPVFSTSNQGTFTFSGTNDYVNLGNVFDASPNFTINSWVKNEGSGQGGILTKGEVNDSAEWGLLFGYSNPLLVVARPRGPGQQLTKSWVGYTVGFHNIAYSVVGSSASRLFIDGVLVANNTLSSSPTTVVGNLQIAYHGTLFYFNHSIAAVSYYNRALTDVEIQQNFNALRGRFGL